MSEEYATRRELGTLKGQMTMLRKAFLERGKNVTVRLESVEAQASSLIRLSVEGSDAPDPVEAFNEVAGCLEAQLEEIKVARDAAEETFNEDLNRIETDICDLQMQIVELRSALAQSIIALAETRKIADKCAELLGVRT